MKSNNCVQFCHNDLFDTILGDNTPPPFIAEGWPRVRRYAIPVAPRLLDSRQSAALGQEIIEVLLGALLHRTARYRVELQRMHHPFPFLYCF